MLFANMGQPDGVPFAEAEGEVLFPSDYVEAAPSWKVRARKAAAAEVARRAAAEQKELAKNALALSNTLSDLLNMELTTTTLELTVDGVTFGYRAVSGDGYTTWKVYIVELREECDSFEPNGDPVKREQWFGPIYHLTDLGEYLNGDMKGRIPRTTPIDREVQASLAPEKEAENALACGWYEQASAAALVSIAQNLDTIVRNGGLR